MNILKKGAAVIMSACLLIGSIPATASAKEQTEIVNLKVNDVVNPIGIDTNPSFSWQMTSTLTGEKQTAYQITVWDISDSSDVVWDSGKVESDESVSIKYEGSTLESSKRYGWTVSVWNSQGDKLSPSEETFFETGLLDEEDWSGAYWIKTGDSTTVMENPVEKQADYTIDVDIRIINTGVALIFEAQDKSNFLMWQLRTDEKNTNKLLLRPHYCKNGNFTVVGETDITDKANGGVIGVQHLQIRVKNNAVTTFVNGSEVNTIAFSQLGGINPEGAGCVLGFRADYQEKEDGWMDNIVVTDYSSDESGQAVKSYDFDDGVNPFDAGSITSGRLYTTYTAGSTLVSLEESQVDTEQIKYSVEADITCQTDAVSLVFSAVDNKNLYMWQFNTEETPGRVLFRPHAYIGGTFSVYTSNVKDITSIVGSTDEFSKTEAHIKIDVTQDNIKTYVNGTLVDTLTVGAKTGTGAVAHTPVIGGIGTRTSGDETGTIDNFTLINYLNNESGEVVYSYDFESLNPFASGEIENGKYIAAGNNGVTLAYSGADTFRKEFKAQKQVASAKIYMSGLGVFDAYINGERIGTKNDDGTVTYDELKPGYTKPGVRAFYYTYDVTDYINSNAQNTVSASVTTGWWGGAITGNYGTNSAFKAKLLITYQDGTQDIVITDSSWKSCTTGPVLYGDIYGGEIYDANADVSYRDISFDDSGWYYAKKDTQFSGVLCAQAGAEVRIRSDLVLSAKTVTVYNGVTGETSSKYGTINVTGEYSGGEFALKKGETAVVDLGQNFAGWEQITVNGDSGTVITIRHGEMLNDNDGLKSRGNDGAEGSVYTANLRSAAATTRYIMSGDGDETYHPTNTFYGFRYLSVTASKDVTFKSIKGLVTTSALEDTGFIETSDSKVNQLISNIKWGQYSNYLSVPTDCPQRDERQGWTADAQVFSGAAAYNADSKAFLRKFTQDMRDAQRSDGAFTGTAPYENYGSTGQLGWCDAGVIIPYNLYKMYGDKSIIKENYEAMKKFMDVFMASTNKKGAGHDYGDWLAYESNDETIKSMLGVVYYAYDALLMVEMANAIGKTEDAARYQQVYEDEKEYFISNYVNAKGNLKRTEQTVCLMALKFDLLPDEASRETVKQTLLNNISRNSNKLQTGFLGTSVIMQTLSDIGASDVAYKLLLQEENPSWLYSVNQGATTIWERWNSYTKESGFGDVSMNSFNHYAYGAVSEWMFGYMAGISTDTQNTGFKRIVLQPEPDSSIGYVNCSYESPYGTIVSNWKYENGYFSYNSEIPANTTAEISIPATEYNEITVNGVKAGELTLEQNGIECVETADGKAVFEAVSGKFSFSIQYSSNTDIESVTVDGVAASADGQGFAAAVPYADSHSVEVVTSDNNAAAVYNAETGIITVTAEDGTVKEYTLAVTDILSSNTEIASVKVDNLEAIRTGDAFAVTVAKAESHSVVITAEDKNATAVYDSASGKITVTAQDGTIKEYTLIIAEKTDTNNSGSTTTPPAVTNGTQVVNGKTVLYVNGKQVTGTKVVTVSGKTYAVVGGYVKTGKKQVVKIGSKYYIVNASGVVQKGTKNKLIKVGTKSYVVNKNGVVQRKASGKKLVKVGTKSYIVNKLGIVQKGTKNKLVKIGKKKYVVNKKGVVQKNKKSIKVGKKTYKTNKKGVATLKR